MTTNVVLDAQLRQAARQVDEARAQARNLRRALRMSDGYRGLSRPVFEAVAKTPLQENAWGEFVCPFREVAGCEATTGQIPAGILGEDEWDAPHGPLCPVTLSKKLLALPPDLRGVADLERETEEARHAGDGGATRQG
jgi:hypothetical protein